MSSIDHVFDVQYVWCGVLIFSGDKAFHQEYLSFQNKHTRKIPALKPHVFHHERKNQVERLRGFKPEQNGFREFESRFQDNF